MFMVDLTSAEGMLMALMIAVLTIILGKEFKKSAIPAIGLGIFLISILLHTFQSITITDEVYRAIATKSLAIDAIMIFLTYIAYLWVDDIEVKEKNRKSIDNSLDWFWKKI